jgi:dihydroflavonol-4-reductase
VSSASTDEPLERGPRGRDAKGRRSSERVEEGGGWPHDVADLHLWAMTDPAANGERFIAIAGASLWLVDVARVLRQRLVAEARKVPAHEIPNTLVRLAARTNPAMRGMVPFLGLNMNATSETAIRLLGWAPRPAEDAIAATAESLIQLGLLAD